MNKYSWTENDEGQIFIYNQEESVKPKNIVEKIDFESEYSCAQSWVCLESNVTVLPLLPKIFKIVKNILIVVTTSTETDQNLEVEEGLSSFC